MDLVFPRFCLSCGFVGVYLCPSCLAKLQPAPPTCLYCEKKSLLGLTHPSCKRGRGVDGVYSFYQYDGLLKKIIHTGKYKGAWRIFSSLPCNSNSLQEWSPLFDTPLLCPVPLHPHKRAQRGYNQSQKISELCLSHLGWKSFDGIIKEKESSPQATRVSRKERRDNVRSTFSFTGMAVPETVVLVDDVITTGATVSECALVLKKSGVRTVLAISLARG